MKTNVWQRLNTWEKAHPRSAALSFMMASTLGFSLMNICVRLASETLDAALVVTLRNLLTLLILIPLVAPNRFAIIRTERLFEHFRRSFVGVIGMITWTYCLTLMPLVHSTALSFTAPLLATVFAIVFLKERATKRHGIGLVLGMVGVLIILRPAAGGFDWTSLLVIVATTSWAITSLLIKALTRTEPPMRMVFYMNLFMFFLALPLGARHWIMPTPHEWAIILGIALCSIFMHFTMVRAYALAPVSELMPLDFMRLVYTSLFAWLIFSEPSDIYTWIGGAVIIVGVVYASRKNPAVDERVEPV